MFPFHCVLSLIQSTQLDLQWTRCIRTSWSQTSSSVLLCSFFEQPWIDGKTMKYRISMSQTWLKATLERHKTVLTCNNSFQALQPFVSRPKSRILHMVKALTWPHGSESWLCHGRHLHSDLCKLQHESQASLHVFSFCCIERPVVLILMIL